MDVTDALRASAGNAALASTREVADEDVIAPHWIGGRPVASARTFKLWNPSTGGEFGRAAAGGSAEIDLAVQAALECFQSYWSKLSVLGRAEVLLGVATRLAALTPDLAQPESRNNGMPVRFTSRMVTGIHQEIEFYAGLIRGLREGLTTSTGTGFAMTVRQPFGVVGLIVPFNAPLSVMAEKIGQALSAGNCVVIKPSPLAPLTATLLCQALERAGLPPGMVNVVLGDGPETGKALCEHPSVGRISFTGSSAIGRVILRGASDQLKRVSLELSGRGCTIVCADGDLETACESAAFSCFWNAGQICTSGAKILIDRRVFDRFSTLFVERVRHLRVGDATDPATDIGPVITREHRDHVEELISASRPGVDELYVGEVPSTLTGSFMAPRIMQLPSLEHPLIGPEYFAPVACLVRFEEDSEALQAANRTDFGLANAVWTRDLERARYFAMGLESGRVWVNTCHTIPPDMSLPPWKMSGIGVEGGLEGLTGFSQLKTINMNAGGEVPRF